MILLGYKAEWPMDIGITYGDIKIFLSSIYNKHFRVIASHANQKMVNGNIMIDEKTNIFFWCLKYQFYDYNVDTTFSSIKKQILVYRIGLHMQASTHELLMHVLLLSSVSDFALLYYDMLFI
ncbi:hypothetical protein ACJX0J_039392, partial [Zea mays]